MATITLITGANKGLGRETARRLRDEGHTVLLAARDAGRGATAAAELGVEFLPLDVTDDGSVARAAGTVRERYGRLDVLVNNAGITGPLVPLAEAGPAEAAAVFDTNVFGVLRVTKAFVPLLRASTAPRIVMVSSDVGSFANTLANDWWDWRQVPPLYAATKSALTMLTLRYAADLPEMRVNAAAPGWTATDLNDFQGVQTVTEGTDAIVHLATLPADGPTGTYRSRHGEVPW